MQCPHCGNTIAHNSHFCSVCNTPVNTILQSSPSQPPIYKPTQSPLRAVSYQDIKLFFFRSYREPGNLLRDLQGSRGHVIIPLFVVIASIILSFLAGFLATEQVVRSIFNIYVKGSGLALRENTSSLYQSVSYVVQGIHFGMGGVFALAQFMMIFLPISILFIYLRFIRKIRTSFSLLFDMMGICTLPTLSAVLLFCILAYVNLALCFMILFISIVISLILLNDMLTAVESQPLPPLTKISVFSAVTTFSIGPTLLVTWLLTQGMLLHVWTWLFSMGGQL